MAAQDHEGGRGQALRGTPEEAMRRFLGLALRYWREEMRAQAWSLTAGIVFLALLSIGIQVAINRWNRFFFDAIDKKQGAVILQGVGLIFILTLAAAGAAVAMVHCRMRLQVRWRQWLTRRMLGYWFADRRFYQLTIVGSDDINPEYRIGEDVRLATEPIVDFVIGLSTALLTAAAFLGILWSVGGSLAVPLFGTTLVVPGYMVAAVIVYSVATSGFMWLIGRPLVHAVDTKNAGEAQFRYEMTRVRESAETIALIGGDEDERAHLDRTFTALVARWFAVIKGQARMTWLSNANSVLAPVVPLLLGAPNYLNGDMSLGSLMQVAAAFVQVQTALNYLVDNAIRFAEWHASAQRVGVLNTALARLDAAIGEGAGDTIVLGDSPDDKIRIEDLSIAQQNGKIMIKGAAVEVSPGEKILVKGESGTGKSTLIRAMAGLWPWGSGRILRPAGATIMFMPQQPYIPLGTLRHALLYPDVNAERADDVFAQALGKCGLSHLVERLDDEDHWNRILSGGEQQRLAFARLLITKPDIIIMDEATSALDELSQQRMMDFLTTDLVDATVLSVAHRPGLEKYHTREIDLVRVPGETYVSPRDRRYRIVRSIAAAVAPRRL